MKSIKSLGLAFALSLVATAALAQQSGLSGPQHRHAGPGFAPPQEGPKVKTDEKAYRRALDAIPDKKISDPWQSVREVDPTKTNKKGPN